MFTPSGGERSPQASALRGKGGACVFQVPSTSHFLLFLHTGIYVDMKQTLAYVPPNMHPSHKVSTRAENLGRCEKV